MATNNLMPNGKLQATNAQIFNAIRTDASSAYAQRIPAATQGDSTATIAALNNFALQMNEFIDVLVNRIGDVMIKQRIWSNPLSEFKRGMMAFGDTVQEIYINLMKSKRFDPQQVYEDVWRKNPPEVFASYHRITRQDYYEVSIDQTILQRAFLNEASGLQTMINSILERPYSSDEFDEYLIMKNLFLETARNDGFFKVQVPDPSLTTNLVYPQREFVAKQITEAVRTWSRKLSFPSSAYNPQGVTTWSPNGGLVLFTTPDIEALLDVNVIAQAFNVSAAQINDRVIVVDDLGISGCVAILADMEYFVCADTHISFESIYNPKGLSWNYWLHHHGIYSASRFVNTIMFTTEEGTELPIPDVTLASVDIVKGYNPDGTQWTNARQAGSFPLIISVNGTIDPDDPRYVVPAGVTFEIIDIAVPLAAATSVSPEGWLIVDRNEDNTEITIECTTTFLRGDESPSTQIQKIAEITVTIDPFVD